MASLRLTFLVCALGLVGCYDVPTPPCGFRCGPPTDEDRDGTCPDGYVCRDERCRLMADYPDSCPGIEDPDLDDNTPPGIQARSPTPDETGVPLDATVLVTFDEAVFNVDASTFGLSTDTGFASGSVSVVSPERAFRFTPQRPLSPNKVYEVVLGASILDLAFNPLPETRWTFSTIEERTPPMIVNQSFPTTGANENDPLVVFFSEPITGVSPTSVRLEQSGTLVPTMFVTSPADQVHLDHDPLLGETTYSLIFTDEIMDLNGNRLVPTTLTFTTRDITPPAIVNRLPAPSASDRDEANNPATFPSYTFTTAP